MNNAHLNLSMLRVLDALAVTGSFTGAAERACMTQSGVSHAIRALEEAVGGPLVARERSGARLTRLGREALEEARIALAAVDRLRSLGGRASARGPVRIALVASAAARIAPGALARLAREHPLVEPSLIEGTDDEVRAWVADGLADLGVSGEALPGALPLAEDELLLVAPSGHPLLDGEAARLEALDGAPFVMSAAGCGPMLERLFAAASVKPAVRLRVREVSALLAMVAAGLGVSIVPVLNLPQGRASGGAPGIETRPLAPRLFRRLHLLRAPASASAGADAASEAFLAEAAARPELRAA